MRLWAWEKNRYLQEQKRRVLWSVAVVCWVLALAAAYWVEHTLYGEIIETNTFVILGYSIGIPTGFGLRKAMGKEDRPLTKKDKWINGIIVAVSFTVILWGAVFRGMVVYTTQLICVLPVLYWSDHEKKKDIDRSSMYACTLLFAAGMLVIGTLAGAKLTGYTTTYDVEKNIAAEGYEEVEYLGWMYGRWVYQDAKDPSFYEERMRDEKYYMLFGRKDGMPWRFIVDPKGGEIILAATEQDEPELGHWYRSEEAGV